MREAHEIGDEWSEDGEAQVLGDKRGEVRKERWIECPLDAGRVKPAIFSEGMEAMDQERREGERGDERGPA